MNSHTYRHIVTTSHVIFVTAVKSGEATHGEGEQEVARQGQERAQRGDSSNHHYYARQSSEFILSMLYCYFVVVFCCFCLETCRVCAQKGQTCRRVQGKCNSNFHHLCHKQTYECVFWVGRRRRRLENTPGSHASCTAEGQGQKRSGPSASS